jgi:hypothetical protein
MVFLNKKILILIIILLPTTVFAYKGEGDFEEERKLSQDLPLTPLVDETAKPAGEPKPPINDPDQVPEMKERRFEERLINPNEKDVPLINNPNPNVPEPVYSPHSVHS